MPNDNRSSRQRISSTCYLTVCVRNGNQDYSTEGYKDDEQGTEGIRDADHLEFFFFSFFFHTLLNKFY